MRQHIGAPYLKVINVETIADTTVVVAIGAYEETHLDIFASISRKIHVNGSIERCAGNIWIPAARTSAIAGVVVEKFVPDQFVCGDLNVIVVFQGTVIVTVAVQHIAVDPVLEPEGIVGGQGYPGSDQRVAQIIDSIFEMSGIVTGVRRFIRDLPEVTSRFTECVYGEVRRIG